MDAILEVHQNTVIRTAPRNALHHWATKTLCEKGYSTRVAARAVQEQLGKNNNEHIDFIQWVADKPVYQTAEALRKLKAKTFVQQQLTRSIHRILIRKGYSKQAVHQLSAKLIYHAGGVDNCDIQAAISAARHWPQYL